MNLFDDHDSDRNSYERICDKEDNESFIMVVSLLSLLNKVFYTPVSFLIEYVENKTLQDFIEKHTGYNRYRFIVQFTRNFPNVAKSRRLKNIVDKLE